MSISRWFQNPYQDFTELPTPEEFRIDQEKFKKQGLDLMEQVFTKGGKSGEGGLYVGAVGSAYMLIHCKNQLSDTEKAHFTPFAQNALQKQFMYSQVNPSKRYEL